MHSGDIYPAQERFVVTVAVVIVILKGRIGKLHVND